MLKSYFVIAVSIFFVLSCVVSAQNEGEKIFTQQCASCHKIGGGAFVGPDLANVQKRRTEDWIIKFVDSPQSMINAGDSVAKALYNQFHIIMPDHKFTANQIKSIIAFIESKSPSGGNETGNSAAEVFGFTSYSSQDVEIGKNLFVGKTRLTNKGPACISCHNIENPTVFSGGLLAKDLTTAYSRLSPAGIGGILSNPPFPAMADAFASRPLTKDEINYLLAFLNYTDGKGTFNATPLQGQFDFIIGVVVGLVYLFALFMFLWLRVKKHSVYLH